MSGAKTSTPDGGNNGVKIPDCKEINDVALCPLTPAVPIATSGQCVGVMDHERRGVELKIQTFHTC